jgi:hypothetical protein
MPSGWEWLWFLFLVVSAAIVSSEASARQWQRVFYGGTAQVQRFGKGTKIMMGEKRDT